MLHNAASYTIGTDVIISKPVKDKYGNHVEQNNSSMHSEIDYFNYANVGPNNNMIVKQITSE